jgi:hypothetical protein
MANVARYPNVLEREEAVMMQAIDGAAADEIGSATSY